MSEIAALIAKLEALDGPSREVDGEIWRAALHGSPRGLTHGPVPELTASIDAAVALVERCLPGWYWSFDCRSIAITHPVHGVGEAYIGESPTPAIALCIALLRAMEGDKP